MKIGRVMRFAAASRWATTHRGLHVGAMPETPTPDDLPLNWEIGLELIRK
jgi:hypothetical protein